jgi:RNA polymerase-binding protein DksA
MAKKKKSIKRKATKKKVKTKTVKAVKVKRLPKKELEKYKKLLLKERNQIGGDLSHITENTLKRSQREVTGDLSGYSYHMADQASDDYERDFSLGRATEEQKMLYAIDEAMKRIEEGTYGLCLQCGKPISKKRLTALPHAELCIDCKKKNEAR